MALLITTTLPPGPRLVLLIDDLLGQHGLLLAERLQILERECEGEVEEECVRDEHPHPDVEPISFVVHALVGQDAQVQGERRIRAGDVPPVGEKLVHGDGVLRVRQGRDPEAPDPPVGDLVLGQDEAPEHKQDEERKRAERVGDHHRAPNCTDGAEQPDRHLVHQEQQHQVPDRTKRWQKKSYFVREKEL